MDLLELFVESCTKQRVQNFQQHAAGMLGRKCVRGKKCKDAQPDQRGDPRAQLARRSSGYRLMNGGWQ